MIYKGYSLVVLLTIVQNGKGEDYLVAVAYRGKGANIWSTAGDTGGLVELQYPRFVGRGVRQFDPFGVLTHPVNDKMKTSEIENAAFILSGSDEDINIVVVADGVFSPLPVSALGTKYILPSSLAPNSRYRSLLLIATHNTSTTVDVFIRMNRGSITFAGYGYSGGDKLSLKLYPYQTLKMSTPYDLNGTIITSEHSIAVYSGMEYASKYTVYDQLLPVKHYGQEYVVAADDFKLDLQIISEHSHVQITFSSRATASTGERRLYNRSLERGESLHFTATSPVLVTLSRADGYSSAFTTVPPVQSYVTHTGIGLYYNNLRVKLKILTDRRATVLVKDKDKDVNELLTWRDISDSRYKVGTLEQSQSRRIYSTFMSSDLPFTVLSFYNGSVYDIGFNLPTEEALHYTGQTYLMPLARNMYHSNDILRILASAGERGGQWQVQDPHTGRVWSRRFGPHNTDYFYLDITSTMASVLLIRVSDDAIQLQGGMNSHTVFSPLPVSALGTKYIMSSCLPTTDNIFRYPRSLISVLVIATHSKKADIDIIFRVDGNVTYDNKTYTVGETLSVRIDKYQTFSLNSSSDMTRTIVNATETIAVYSGTYDLRRTTFTAFEQLLPVKHYGHEYIIPIQDPYYYYRIPYQLQVVTDHSDTSIMFNNGSSISVGEDGVYRKQCRNPETFYFNTTRPVMATLCTVGRSYYYYALVVVPPVSHYSKLTTQQTPGTLQILTDIRNNNMEVQHSYDTLSTVFSSPIKWKNVSGTRYKVGTLGGGSSYITTTIRSESTFAVLGYDRNTIYNGGYSFRTQRDTGSSTPDGIGNKLNTSESFQGTSLPDTHGIKLNTAGSTNNATLIEGVVCGSVIVALLVAFIAYVFYIRRTTIPVKKAAGQAADAPSTSMNIYAEPNRGTGAAVGEDAYTELRFNSIPGDININNSTATYVNISIANTSMNQQC